MKKNLRPEGIIIAITPAIAYFLTYLYERSYMDEFGIPWRLISIDITNVLALTTFLLLIFFTFFTLDSIFIYIDTTSPIGKRIQSLSTLYSLTFINICLFGRLWKSWIIFLAIAIFFSLVEFLLPVFTEKDKKNYIEKLKAAEERDNKVFMGRFYEFLKSEENRFMVNIIIFILFGASFAISTGSSEALTKELFPVINDSQELVVLRIYKDKLICAPFDREKKEVYNTFVIKELIKETDITFEMEKIGRLKLREEHVDTKEKNNN